MRIVNAAGPCQEPQPGESDPVAQAQGTSAATGGVPAEHAATARALRAAEDRLFPLAMVDADRYRWAVQLVGALASLVEQRCADWAALEAAKEWLPGELEQAAGRLAIPLSALDTDLVVDSARAARMRSLLVEAEQARREALIRGARVAGQPWVTLEEPDPAALTFGAGQWLEQHTEREVTLVRAVSLDVMSGAPRYHVAMQGDGIDERETFEDADSWHSRYEALREFRIG